VRSIVLLLGFLHVSAALAGTAPVPSFADRQDYSQCNSGGGPSLALADFNGDGIPDLICQNGLFLFLGVGDGTFGAPTTIPITVFNDNLAALPFPVDLNGDGKMDIVSLGQIAGQGGEAPLGVAVSLGNGDGTFQPSTFYQIGDTYATAFIVSGDFNGDGIPDIATEGTEGIWLLNGAGNGLLKPAVLIPVNRTGGAGLFAFDVNGDSKLDLVATGGTGFTVLLGNGDGTFQPEMDAPVPSRFTSGFAVGDLNGDGIPDVIVVSALETFGLPYFGNGDGTFTVGRKVNLAVASGSVAIGDLNGDGFADIVTCAGEVVLGNDKGAFSAPVYYPISSSGVYVTTAHLRNPDLTDLVFQDSGGGLAYFTGASVLVNEGKGRFQEGETVPVAGGGAGCSVAGDFNGDGNPDLAVMVTQGLSIMLGTGKALEPFTQGQILSVSGVGCPVEGDLNGDGVPDLLVASGSPGGSAIAYLGNGDGTFAQVAQTTPMSTTGSLVLGDFNGDGILDWASASNLLALGNGDGTFQIPRPFIPTTVIGPVSGIAAERISGNKNSDIVLTAANYIYILLSGGSGFKQETLNIQDICYAPGTPLLADVNGDGLPDIVLQCYSSSATPIFLNDRQGFFYFRTSLGDAFSGCCAVPLVADVNGDGIADVMAVSGGDVAVFAGEGSMDFADPIYLGVPGAANVLALNVHGQNPRAGLRDIVVPDGNGALAIILNTTRK